MPSSEFLVFLQLLLTPRGLKEQNKPDNNECYVCGVWWNDRRNKEDNDDVNSVNVGHTRTVVNFIVEILFVT